MLRRSAGCRHVAILAVALAASFAGAAIPLEGELRVASLRVLFARDGRGQVHLSADLPTEIVLPAYRLDEDGVSVTVGGVSLGSFRPVEAGVRVKERESWLHEIRVRRAEGRAAGRLVLDRGHGHVDLKAGPLDLSALRAAGPAGVAIVVRMGATTFTATVDAVADGNRFTYVRTPEPFVPPPPGPPPPPPALTLRILETGLASAIHLEERAVARNWTDYGALWARHHPPVPPGLGLPDVGPPTVDFATEIVVAVFLGDRMNGETVEFAGVAANGAGATVTWNEVLLGPTCPVPMYIQLPTPYVLAAITRVAGGVAFAKQTIVRNCP